jgi:hypothetical protein
MANNHNNMKIFEFLSNTEIAGIVDESVKFLPLVHAALYEDHKHGTKPAQEFIENMELGASIDGGGILYLYYGRHARRFYYSKNNKTDEELRPVFVFIVNKILEEEIEKVYLFDSGAFEKYYKENKHIDQTADISDFELPNNYNAIQQYIKAVFGSNRNYYYGNNKDDNGLPDCIKQERKRNKGLDDFLKFISLDENSPIDDRRKTIEIQKKGNYSLSGNLLAVVIPNFIQSKRRLMKKLTKICDTLEVYKCNKDTDPCCHEDICNCVEKCYKEKGII